MIRYYFHIRDGWDLIPDDEGIEFATWNAAQAEACAGAKDLARTNCSRVCAVQIADRDGRILASVKVPQAA